MNELATKLASLSITEISAVDDPANEIPGFMLMKARGKTPERGSRFHVMATPDHPEISAALTHDDCDVVKLLYRDGRQENVLKSALEEGDQSAGASAVSFSARRVEKSSHAQAYWRGSLFREAETTRRFNGQFFR